MKVILIFFNYMTAKTQTGIRYPIMCACVLSPFSRETLWTIPRQTSLSMEFSRQENWSG